MKIQQIRSATVKVIYGGKTFLLDPWLIGKEQMGSIRDAGYVLEDKAKEVIPMPMCELPMSVEEILADVDAYIITHIHPDHLDINVKGEVNPFLHRDTLTFVHSEEDAAVLRHSGFTNIEVIEAEGSTFGEAVLHQTPCKHGTIISSAHAAGIVFSSLKEKTLYVAGDTVWFEGVAQSIATFKPDIIITNNCAAELLDYGRLIMDVDDLEQVCLTAPEAVVIASHMDTVSHANLTRITLKIGLEQKGLAERVLIPADGESYNF